MRLHSTTTMEIIEGDRELLTWHVKAKQNKWQGYERLNKKKNWPACCATCLMANCETCLGRRSRMISPLSHSFSPVPGVWPIWLNWTSATMGFRAYRASQRTIANIWCVSPWRVIKSEKSLMRHSKPSATWTVWTWENADSNSSGRPLSGILRTWNIYASKIIVCVPWIQPKASRPSSGKQPHNLKVSWLWNLSQIC